MRQITRASQLGAQERMVAATTFPVSQLDTVFSCIFAQTMPGFSSAAPQHQHGTHSSTPAELAAAPNPAPTNSSKKDREALVKDGGASKATREKMTTTKNNLRSVVVAH